MVEQYFKKKNLPSAVRMAVALRYGCEPGCEKNGVKCHYCDAVGGIHWQRLHSGKPGSWVALGNLEFDHVVPEFRGGEATAENIVLACRRCNRSKGARTPEEWRQ